MMLAIITAGIAMGMLGSFHCIGMCGPLALSLPLNNTSIFKKFIASFLYNAGRVVTYTFIGLLFGLIGHSFALFGFQQILSIIIGSLLLLFLIFNQQIKKNQFSIPFINQFFNSIRKQLGHLYKKNHFSTPFLIGVLNGLLPCGLVYMAVAGALATGHIYWSMLFMAAFGLGTLPVMWTLAFFGNYVSARLRTTIRSIQPYLLAVMACLLILRGLGLGIPYISPSMNDGQKTASHCAPTP